MKQLPPKLDPWWTEAALNEIAALLLRHHNRDIKPFTETFLMKSVARRMAAKALDSLDDYILSLANESIEAETLINSLNIGFSEFFRDPLVFALLGQFLLPGIVADNKNADHSEIRIWSAGCAAGQEAFSVALLLEHLLVGCEKQFSYRIIATDMSEKSLVRARRGQYSADEIKNIPLKFIDKYFLRQGESYQVVEYLKGKIDFSIYDLLDTSSICPPISIFGDFDLILCCNLLLYYRPASRQAMLKKLRRCLAPRGYLACGETERAIVEELGWFCPVAPPAAVFRKK